MVFDILQMVIVLALAFAIVFPLGRYIAAVFMLKPTLADPVLNPIDGVIYRACGIKPEQQMRWPAYVKAMLLTNLAMWLLIFATLEVQHLPLFGALNPDSQGSINPLLAFMQASSFITNTDWQNYAGESTFSYLSQMFGLIFPMFTSAATGLACGIAFIRGLGGSVNLGNFYVDLTRAITRIMLPISLVVGIAFVGLGIPATFAGAQTVTTLNGPLTPASPAPGATPTPAGTPSATAQGQQTITRGPIAALASIKHLGTNGGGWFNANSAHPFENPSPITNVLEILLMAAIPTSLIHALGIMLHRKKQAWMFFGAMAAFFIAFLVLAYVPEKMGNPLLTGIGVSAAQGNMEGKEVRFGQAQT
ncbi:MAG: potassium-transporting ATPase subunit KdpA, partial [Chloroflexota bacterium]